MVLVTRYVQASFNVRTLWLRHLPNSLKYSLRRQDPKGIGGASTLFCQPIRSAVGSLPLPTRLYTPKSAKLTISNIAQTCFRETVLLGSRIS
jgi:hypothetical protein